MIGVTSCLAQLTLGYRAWISVSGYYYIQIWFQNIVVTETLGYKYSYS